MNPYEIIKTVNQRTDNAFEWKEGTLYPWLHRLEGEGLIQSRWVEADSGRQRKYYRITRRGLATLAERKEEWTSFSRAVTALLLAQQRLRALLSFSIADVFGGMGSWNDMAFDGEDETRYQEVTEKLYAALRSFFVSNVLNQ